MEHRSDVKSLLFSFWNHFLLLECFNFFKSKFEGNTLLWQVVLFRVGVCLQQWIKIFCNQASFWGYKACLVITGLKLKMCQRISAKVGCLVYKAIIFTLFFVLHWKRNKRKLEYRETPVFKHHYIWLLKVSVLLIKNRFKIKWRYFYRISNLVCAVVLSLKN